MAAGVKTVEGGLAPLRLGVCYYPEQWPEAGWAGDARRMRAMGLSVVRIGEFAWSRIEPEPGRFDWGWLDRAIATLTAAGLQVILGTPTATPPKWLVDAHPDILPCDAQGQPRRFGSRRHYCFSSDTYRRESDRIVTALVARYGEHPAVIAWQTDNEYGCHDTVESFSPAATVAFRAWLERRYRDIDALNTAWGTVFWSGEYRGFAAVDPPAATVTEANPAHRLDWRRFSSDQVVAFNARAAAIIRAGSPGRDVAHNFMGFFTGFDHHAVGRDLDAAGWDSYPLGFLDGGWDDAATKRRFLRQGHPDFAAFHHDLYRGCTPSQRLWVLEQQPGPVNWAAHNPAPLPGMVRLWTWEAWAHGAGLVSYFRWRQAPFGQEQMHAGLLRPDSEDGPAAAEVRAVAAERAAVQVEPAVRAPVALLFSYEAQWVLDIQPQGRGWRALEQVFGWYTALRGLGLDVDIVSPDADLLGYRLIVAPSLPVVSEALAATLAASEAVVLLGPRTASRTADFQLPLGLPRPAFGDALPIRVTRVESLPRGVVEPVEGSGGVERWLEQVEGEIEPSLRLENGAGLVWRHRRLRYVAGWPTPDLLVRIVREAVEEAGLAVLSLPPGLRLRSRGGVRFAFNYEATPIALSAHADVGELLLGSDPLPAGGVAAWRT
ncbi:beta-galactosidase [Sphingomonas sp.]|uniref:beta-galactosidase n=1 Tax=Sphingomonas sp. TaxID=28214 RepID=UPI003CC67854